MSGTLYLCATPIGNLEDMTYRAVRILNEVDLIAAEDTRNSIKLLNHFDIKTPMTSYHEFNKYEKADYLVGKLLEGMDIAEITDAGTPGISDPGEELVKRALDAGITVTAVPGPVAFVNALIISGQATRRFVFEAFLPTDKKERKAVLESFQRETRTIIMYEAPHRLKKTLVELLEWIGDRKLSICKELTKRYENIFRTTIQEAIAYYEKNDPKGEFVLVIEGRSQEELQEEEIHKWDEITLEDHMQIYLDKGMSKKEAMKAVASDRRISKRDVYQQLIAE
ncbi:16S rRNA (cytidine(1402)-2'-O)-methyltransferase [[Clostridium] polysaccharolyticum]|uniref:Ribosomal RNA small subunit methyltransferase I n=1 Tax=[Clostridium] polysaccharolyticum TaxID=29364 RepID=A0A1I0FNH7_9FIRM|nr:16S rRNA (cytidine(1402)-2'-O)-methyltransferase [[Clostridium] polysaccharolyticum]SET59796.1 16S rRNA (cytidine1402-2'-O)-methyltransferase [[Clostridium] polysaccharolyticum]